MGFEKVTGFREWTPLRTAAWKTGGTPAGWACWRNDVGRRDVPL